MEPRPPLPPTDDADAPELDDAERADLPLGPDLSALPIAGITRRRLGFLGGAFLSAWILIVFARQVGEASAASARVDELREANEAAALQVRALENELELIQRQKWIVQQARGYRLGDAGETPFSIAGAEPLPGDAPGSAAVRLGAGDDQPTPLESWLSLLFGPLR